MNIKTFHARTILNSRGEWTIEVELVLASGFTVRASVPTGKSTGTHEAKSVSAEKAVAHVSGEITDALRGMDVSDQSAIDARLIALDGTKDKSRLGANAILAVSMAVARAAALVRHVPLWKHLGELHGADIPRDPPRLFMNVINGGLHAGSGLMIQEYVIIPKAKTTSEAVATGIRLYQNLKEICRTAYGESSINVGDEGGFTPACKDDLEPFELIKKAASGLAIDVGIDAAATNIKKSAHELMQLYERMRSNYHIHYIEDPFGEEEFNAFRELKDAMPDVLIMGDDLTVTDLGRMAQAEKAGSVNAVIIKPNQIGTVSETIEAVKKAREYGWRAVVSHRSGETNDAFIADLAVGLGAYGIKLGAPARGERVAKYNRLLEIEGER